MKKTLQFFLIGICIFTSYQNVQAQTTVTVNGAANWLGYANVFQTNGTTFAFGSSWALPDLKTTLTASTNTLKLQPNFNGYANATSAADLAYWTNGAGLGNKIFEGNTYVENASLAGQIVTFTGNVTNHNLATGYTAVAFIKGLNPANGYSTDFSVTLPLTTTGAFSLSTVTAIPAGLLVQYGFTVRGLNGNPANETALGNVTVVGTSAPATPVNVTFKVDMTQQTGFTTPYVSGTFNSWSGTANPMTDANADGVWEATLSLVPGSYEYKFSRDNWAGSEQLASGTSCTITSNGFTNRTLVVANQNLVQPTVCWASCAACTATPVNVTFKVDMTQQTGFTTPYVSGTFNSWSGTANPMTDANADGVWEATLSLVPGSYEYKFSRDNWAGSEQLASGTSCTITSNGFTNRTLVVANQNLVQPTVCWASCAACTTNPVTEPMTAAPTPTIPAANVISMFSNAYTNVPVDTWQTSWSSGVLTNIQIQGNDTKKYTNLDFVGVETVTSQINATNMLFLHVDAWTPNMTTFRVKLVDFGANAAFGGGDDVNHELIFTPTLSTWNSYHIPLSNFTGLVTKGHIAQLIFSGLPVGAGTLFVDNVYFTTAALSNQSFDMAKISMFPNPTSNMLTITSANKMDAITVYSVVGQEVMNVNVNADNTVLNVSGLQDGIYLVKVISEGKVSTSKFIKQ